MMASSHSRQLHAGLFLLLFLLLRAVTVSAACYYLNGGLASNDVPCRDDIIESVCCGQGYACLSNGICQATGEELVKPGATEFVRGSCTDKSWRNGACPSFCKDPKFNNLGGGHGLAKCLGRDDDTYYCIDGQSSEATCDGDGPPLVYFAGKPSAITTIGVARPTSTTSSSSTRPTTASSTTSTTSASSTTETATSNSSTTSGTGPASTSAPGPKHTQSDSNESDNNNNNNTVLIAGAVGGVVGGLILGGLGVWLIIRLRKRRKNNKQTQNTTPSLQPVPDNDTSKSAQDAYHYNLHYQNQNQHQHQHQYHPPYGSWNQSHYPPPHPGHSHGTHVSSSFIYEADEGVRAGMQSPQELPGDSRSWR